MDKAQYEQLLDKAYKDLPEVLYKKERFVIPEVSGRIIKTRTQITNFGDIAKHLERDVNHMFKFMLKEIGVRGELGKRGDITLHSRFQPTVLNKAVKKYFNEYVECPHCNSPDTLLEQDGTFKCNACGYSEKKSQL